MIGIYKFTNKLTGESYIGQSTNIHKRYLQHKNRSYEIEQTYFHRMIKHYGFGNFDFEVLEECDRSKLDDREVFYIEKYNTLYPNGYNMSIGGHSVSPQKLDKALLDSIVDDLLHSSLKQSEIAAKHGVGQSAVSMINTGDMWFNENYDYPIRYYRCNQEPGSLYRCSICGKSLSQKTISNMCRSCYISIMPSSIPSKEKLNVLLQHDSFERVGKTFGVTGNAVRKWCRKYGMPYHSSDYTSASVST